MNAQPTPGKSIRSDLLCILLGFLAIGLAWQRLATANVSLLVFHDAAEQSYPWWDYSVRQVQAGRLPLWDPYSNGGRSHIGEGQEGALYPPFLLIARFGGAWALTTGAIHTFAFLHGLLAFLAAYVLARVLTLRPPAALGCGITFALGGFFIDRSLGQLNIYYGTAYVPLILAGAILVVRRHDLRWAFLSGAAVAMSILAGHAQPVFHGLLATALLLLFLGLGGFADVPGLGWRRSIAAGALILGSGMLLAAPQLLPMLEYQPQAMRWVGAAEPIRANKRVPFEVIAKNPSFDPSTATQFAVRGAANIPDSSLYVGCAALLLAAVGATWRGGPLRVYWLLLLGLGIVLAMGSAGKLLWIMYYLVPMTDKVREPSRYLLLAHLSLSVLVGYGLGAVMDATCLRPAAWLPLALAAILIGWTFHSVMSHDPMSPRLSAEFWAAIAAVAATGALLLLAWLRPRLGGVAALLLVVVVAAELGHCWALTLPRRGGFNGDGNLEVHRYYHTPLAEGVRNFFAARSDWFRVDFTDAPVPRNYGMFLSVPTLNGYAATMPEKFFNFRGLAGWFVPARGPDILGVKYVVSEKPVPGAAEVDRIENYGIYQNPNAFPLAWFVNDVRIARNNGQAMTAVGKTDWDPHRTAIVTTKDPNFAAGLDSPQSTLVHLEEYLPGRERLTVRTDRRGLLVTSDPDFPGWVALLDGKPTPTCTVDFAFRGVIVPAGLHTLEFRYRPWSFRIGLTLGILTALGILCTCGRPRRCAWPNEVQTK